MRGARVQVTQRARAPLLLNLFLFGGVICALAAMRGAAWVGSARAAHMEVGGGKTARAARGTPAKRAGGGMARGGVFYMARASLVR